MAAISVPFLPNPNPSFSLHSIPRKFLSLSSLTFAKQILNSKMNAVRSSSSSGYDVVVIGGGIIGLSIAREFLLRSEFSVAVVDGAVPCSGATGAGQGYLWMVNKTPGSDTWDLALRSQKLWQILADSLQDQGTDPVEALGWKKTGSLLIGRTEEELEQLKKRMQQLSAAGVRAEYLSNSDLLHREPELAVSREVGATFLPDDCQLDARRTVAFIEKGNQLFSKQGRYAEFYHDPAVCLLRSSTDGRIEGVQTSENTLYSKKAVIVAAGCWTGSLMHGLMQGSDIAVNVPVRPRKGFLLVLENFTGLGLNHALMEAGYVNHQSLTSASGAANLEESLSISMTATVDSMGNLLIGSSRQFVGFNTEVDMSIVNRVWDRAQEFFPSLKGVSLANLSENAKVRAGLRPYMPDGKPVIGPIPSMPNVYLATGHEGGGLCMAPGTAELIVDMVLGNPLKLDPSPFAVQGRCC